MKAVSAQVMRDFDAQVIQQGIYTGYELMKQ